MTVIQDKEQLQKYISVHGIEPIFNEHLMPHLSLYSYDVGELICSKGDTPEILYLLVKGKIKIFTTSAEGKTLILSFKKPLEVIGDIEYIQGTDLINTVEAVSPVHMIGIPYRWLNQYGRNHPPLLQFLLEIITRKFYIKSNFLSFNLMYPVEVRLASYLLSVTFDESDSGFEGQLSTLSLGDTANLIGTSYRHLNRVIQRFSMEGLVERSKGVILVKNREGLKELASTNIYE
ncbi:Crp/Fnr family transcriptional regulator [Paenibacillus sp. sgz500958]|uniref:Crp/Fnr family transcriptional regulator n=1 Tax=Paenibacillus sp. sgz500958 TaxID=3242475 RepID=UPI0036D3AA29